MELRSKVLYHSSFGTLNPGDTTDGRNYPEEKKQQMLTDFPDWFEVIKPKVLDEEVLHESARKSTKK